MGSSGRELAKAEGCTQRLISYRVCFGRFLAFSINGSIPRNLTERRFRAYWERTDGAANVLAGGEHHGLDLRRLVRALAA